MITGAKFQWPSLWRGVGARAPCQPGSRMAGHGPVPQGAQTSPHLQVCPATWEEVAAYSWAGLVWGKDRCMGAQRGQ